MLPDAIETDNLAALPDLTEEVLLEFLQQRYSKDQIYVSTARTPGALRAEMP